MMYYQAVCYKHNFASSLYVRRADAVRSAKAHRSRVTRPHSIKILDVWVDNVQIHSTEILQ